MIPVNGTLHSWLGVWTLWLECAGLFLNLLDGFAFWVACLPSPKLLHEGSKLNHISMEPTSYFFLGFFLMASFKLMDVYITDLWGQFLLNSLELNLQQDLNDLCEKAYGSIFHH